MIVFKDLLLYTPYRFQGLCPFIRGLVVEASKLCTFSGVALYLFMSSPTILPHLPQNCMLDLILGLSLFTLDTGG